MANAELPSSVVLSSARMRLQCHCRSQGSAALGVTAPVDSANQDLSLFLEHFGLLEGVFSAEEKGSLKIGKLDDSR